MALISNTINVDTIRHAYCVRTTSILDHLADAFLSRDKGDKRDGGTDRWTDADGRLTHRHRHKTTRLTHRHMLLVGVHVATFTFMLTCLRDVTLFKDTRLWK